VRLLAQAGAPTEARLDEGGHTPLHVATMNGKESALRALAAAGAALDATIAYERRERCTPLHLAVLRDGIPCARALLQAGAAADAHDSFGQTPLYLALATGRLPMASALIEAGADPDAPSRDGQTPLHGLLHLGDDTLARFLLERGARPDARNPGGRTALHRAAADGREDLLRLLLDAGADPALGDDEGSHALHHAARRGQGRVLERLLVSPAVDASTPNVDGLTPLHLAAEAGHLEAMRKLLAHGVPVDAPDADGWTPLHLAALGGHAPAVRALVGAGAAVDARSTLPQTRPLILAAELGHVDVVHALLAAGAAVDGGTAHKPAPLASALRYRQFDAARALLEAGAPPDPEGAAWSTRLPAEVALPGAADAVTPAEALRGIFNARGPGTAGDPLRSVAPDAGAQAALEAAQARLLTANAGVLQYRWRAATDEVRARVASDPGLAAAGLRADGPRTAVHVTGLAWYDRALLVRVRDPDWPSPALTAYFVLDAAGSLRRLPGVSAPLHDLAASEPLRLTSANVLGYLKFFCFFVRGDEGAFYVLEQPDDPMVPGDVGEPLRRVLRETVRPAFLDGRDEQGRFVCDAVVWYSNALFIARFAVGEDGAMEMLSDEPIAADLPIRAESPIA
jgi:ankyrin repeat protein